MGYDGWGGFRWKVEHCAMKIVCICDTYDKS